MNSKQSTKSIFQNQSVRDQKIKDQEIKDQSNDEQSIGLCGVCSLSQRQISILNFVNSSHPRMETAAAKQPCVRSCRSCQRPLCQSCSRTADDEVCGKCFKGGACPLCLMIT